MRIGVTYDLRDHYRSLGFPEEEIAEFDSIATIEAIDNALTDLGLRTERIGTIRQLVDRLARGSGWDLIFNIAEGLYGIGREAQVPSLCDAYRIPYTFSDPCVLSLTLNKALAKRVVRDIGLHTPDFMLVRSIDQIEDQRLRFPLFAKPVAEGTSKGINASSVIRDKKALDEVCAFLLSTYNQPVLVESYLPGREFTVGIIGSGDDARPIGVLEVLLNDGAEAGVYSYRNKEYCEDLVCYKLVDDDTALAAADLARDAWRGIGCRDAGRVDIRCDEAGVPNFIEVNPLAGLHPEHSDLPILCTKAGYSYRDLIAATLNSCMKRYGLLDEAPEAIKKAFLPGIDPRRSFGPVGDGRKSIVILHQCVPEGASEDESDVIVQRDEITETIRHLGYHVRTVAVDLDFSRIKTMLKEINPDKVFNIVESLDGHDRLGYFPPALLDSLNIPYTGSGAETLATTGNKILAKRLLQRAGLPTPAYFLAADLNAGAIPEGVYIIKSIYNHASVGIDENAIVKLTYESDKSIIGKAAESHQNQWFAEAFIDGREFNISILNGPMGPEVLPPAEVVFFDYPQNKPKIVGYRAKWDAKSFEYRNTRRRYDFGDDDLDLLNAMTDACLRCWELFGIRDYARVDFRVDANGRPWILEINANPCLSSDAGFMAAANVKGLNPDEVIRRIIGRIG